LTIDINELVSLGDISGTETALVDRIEVLGQLDPGPRSNKWYASTASVQGRSAPVGTSDGTFAITNVPVSAGANALTVTVQDVSGNVATQVVNFTVQTVTNRSEFAYDLNGNLASVFSVPSVVNYGYDAENRLTTVTSNGVAILQCWYDGAGHRIAKREIVGAQTNAVQYVWDGLALVAVLGENGQLQEYYTRGIGVSADIGSLVGVTHYVSGTPSAIYYLHNNHRGDVILAREGTDTVASLDYTPYGEIRSQTGTYTPRLRFSSKEYDASTGLYHYQYRYYAPMWTRWITRDPIEDLAEQYGEHAYSFERGLRDSPYSFTRNAPTDRTDFLGLCTGDSVTCWHLACMKLPTADMRCECHCAYAADGPKCRKLCVACWGGKGKPDPHALCMCTCEASGQPKKKCAIICCGLKAK
jgi:RHS repeat-associated protein